MQEVKSEVRIKVDELRKFCEQILICAGVQEKNAAAVVDVLLYGDMRGIQSHGVRWLNIYTKRIKEGGIRPNDEPQLDKDSKAACLVNGEGGFGQVAMMKALEIAFEKTKEFGVGAVGVRNSNHFGATGYYALKVAEAGLIGIICSNATPLMAPLGGMEAILGTNPFAIGVPAGEHPPIVVDMATSAGARGKIFVAEKKGEQIPTGWALDIHGDPTQDPTEALRGVLLPFAGPKGYGLSLIVEVLGGVLTGSLIAKEIPQLYGKPEQPQDIGHFIILMDIEKFMGLDLFTNRIGSLIKDIKESKKATDVNEIFLPGEIEHNKYLQTCREGIIMAQEIFNDLQELGNEFGIHPQDYFITNIN